MQLHFQFKDSASIEVRSAVGRIALEAANTLGTRCANKLASRGSVKAHWGIDNGFIIERKIYQRGSQTDFLSEDTTYQKEFLALAERYAGARPVLASSFDIKGFV